MTWWSWPMSWSTPGTRSAMLAEVRRLLRPGGEVWISCPNAASLWRRVFGRAWVNWHVPFHLWHFSSKTLQELLDSANFSIIDNKTFTPALWVTQSICLKLSRKEGGRNRLIRCAPLIALMTLTIKLFSPPFFIILIARWLEIV